MGLTIRRIALGDIEHIHPLLATALGGIEMHYLLPETVVTRDGVIALLQSHPIPVTRSGSTVMPLGESRLLTAARTHLDPEHRIPVLDCTALDSEATEATIWSRSALHYLYTAHHPRGYPAATDAIRDAIPQPFREMWCPGIASRRSFAAVTGIARNTLHPTTHSKQASPREQPEGATPLDRIRRGVRRD